MRLPIEREFSQEFIDYNLQVQPDQKYQGIDGKIIDGPSQDDLNEFGFGTNIDAVNQSKESSLKRLAGSKPLRVVGAVGFAFVSALALVPTPFLEAGNFLPPTPDDDPDNNLEERKYGQCGQTIGLEDIPARHLVEVVEITNDQGEVIDYENRDLGEKFGFCGVVPERLIVATIHKPPSIYPYTSSRTISGPYIFTDAPPDANGYNIIPDNREIGLRALFGGASPNNTEVLEIPANSAPGIYRGYADMYTSLERDSRPSTLTRRFHHIINYTGQEVGPDQPMYEEHPVTVVSETPDCGSEIHPSNHFVRRVTTEYEGVLYKDLISDGPQPGRCGNPPTQDFHRTTLEWRYDSFFKRWELEDRGPGFRLNCPPNTNGYSIGQVRGIRSHAGLEGLSGGYSGHPHRSLATRPKFATEGDLLVGWSIYSCNDYGVRATTLAVRTVQIEATVINSPQSNIIKH